MNSDPISQSPLSRRRFVKAASLVALGAGCTGTMEGASDASGDTSSPDGSQPDATVGETDSSGPDGGGPTNRAPQWREIPRQVWIVGMPVYLDLSDYCTDPDGDELGYLLDGELPGGVSREGSIISGTPEGAFAETTLSAIADDGGPAEA